jgi:hypothetical protein
MPFLPMANSDFVVVALRTCGTRRGTTTCPESESQVRTTYRIEFCMLWAPAILIPMKFPYLFWCHKSARRNRWKKRPADLWHLKRYETFIGIGIASAYNIHNSMVYVVRTCDSDSDEGFIPLLVPQVRKKESLQQSKCGVVRCVSCGVNTGETDA